jgi:peptide deformylase
MESNGGIGLAATQIGFNERIFLMKPDKHVQVIVNPVVLNVNNISLKLEGCLSFPGVQAFILRANTIFVKYFDIDMNVYEKELVGIAAHVFLHEYDHLNGVLFINHMEGGVRDEFLARYEQSVRDRRTGSFTTR